MKYDYANLEYTVSGRTGFTLTQALKLWRAKYDDIKDFQKEVASHESLNDFYDFVAEIWDSIEPVTVLEALSQSNAEIRRIYFDCIGVAKLFKELNPTLRNRQVIHKKRMNWDDDDQPYTKEFEDVYEVYEMEGTKLFDVDRWGRTPNSVYAVRCWCTTTNREYWIYVPAEAAHGQRAWVTDVKDEDYDAIRAIAWTIRVDVAKQDIEKIYRQGDIIVCKVKDNPTSSAPYHIDKDMYLDLMYSET